MHTLTYPLLIPLALDSGLSVVDKRDSMGGGGLSSFKILPLHQSIFTGIHQSGGGVHV